MQPWPNTPRTAESRSRAPQADSLHGYQRRNLRSDWTPRLRLDALGSVDPTATRRTAEQIFWPRPLLFSIPISVAVVAIIVMIMPAVPHRTAICHSHVKRALYTESHHGVARNPNRSTSAFATGNRSNNSTHQAVVALRPRFDAL